MKVAIISNLIDVAQGAGSAHSAWLLAQAVQRAGADVIVIAMGGNDIQKTYREGIPIYTFQPPNIYPYVMRHKQTAPRRAIWQLRAWYSWATRDVVYHILKHERPDVVHTHKLRGLSVSVWHAARSAGVRALLHTVRDFELLSPEATLTTEIGRQFANGGPLFGWYRALHICATYALDAVVAPSAFAMQRHVEAGFFATIPQQIIPNSHGFPTGGLLVPDERKPGPLRLLYLGRLDPEKGIRMLLEAVTELESPFRLDVVGTGQLETRLREQFGHLPTITFHGAWYGEAKWSALQACDVVVVPSVIEETFGRVIVEAYAMGKPVIASRIGGMVELVQPMKTGRLVPPGDIQALRAVIESYARHPTQLAAMVPYCVAVAQHYTVEAYTDAHMTLYDELMMSQNLHTDV